MATSSDKLAVRFEATVLIVASSESDSESGDHIDDPSEDALFMLSDGRPTRHHPPWTRRRH